MHLNRDQTFPVTQVMQEATGLCGLLSFTTSFLTVNQHTHRPLHLHFPHACWAAGQA